MRAHHEVITELKTTAIQLSVGLLTADMMNLTAALEVLKSAQVPMVHYDVMDGRTWPKLTAGSSFMAGLKHELLNDVHLLVENPENHIATFAAAGADMISFMVEGTKDIAATLALISAAENVHHRSWPILRGVSLDPGTSANILDPYLDQIDFVVLLAVGPKSGKQTFFEALPAKIQHLRRAKKELYLFIDGAIKKDNIGDVAQLGADAIVTGSAVFDGHDASMNVKDMRVSIAKAISNAIRQA